MEGAWRVVLLYIVYGSVMILYVNYYLSNIHSPILNMRIFGIPLNLWLLWLINFFFLISMIIIGELEESKRSAS